VPMKPAYCNARQALDVLRLKSNACQAFQEQPPTEQRKHRRFVVKTATWQDGVLRTTRLEPFDPAPF
jgi:hypothetical protein